jgi:hypothetical protein
LTLYKSGIGPLAANLASLEIAICFSIEADIHWSEMDDDHMQALFALMSGDGISTSYSSSSPETSEWFHRCKNSRVSTVGCGVPADSFD